MTTAYDIFKILSPKYIYKRLPRGYLICVKTTIEETNFCFQLAFLVVENRL